MENRWIAPAKPFFMSSTTPWNRRMHMMADRLRMTGRWLDRIADGIDAFQGRTVHRSSTQRPALMTMFATGLMAGLGLMYLIDADSGRRHRAMMRDKMARYRHLAGRRLDARRRDMGNRLRGLMMEGIKHARDIRVDDTVLVERIRAHMGHLLSHAETRRIEVLVHDGLVTLRGDVVASHLNRVLGHIATVPGVRGLTNHLRVHPSMDELEQAQMARHTPKGEQIPTPDVAHEPI